MPTDSPANARVGFTGFNPFTIRTPRIRTHYDRYIGEFVIHCHILDHEDGGKMWNIEIVPDLTAQGGGLGMPGMKHSK